MLSHNKKIVTGIVFSTIISIASLTGCSTTDTAQTSSPAGQQPAAAPSMQQPGAPGQPPDNANMDAVLERAAEILGVSSEDFIAAFQNSMPEAPSNEPMGERPAPPTGEGEGQMPPGDGQIPPQGEQGQQPPAPPDGQGTPGGGGMLFMTDIYAKMAEELGLSAEDIAAAIEQAQTELQE